MTHRLAHWFARSGWFILLVLIVLTPIILTGLYITLANRISDTAAAAAHGACVGQNEVRHEVVSFVDDTITRSTRSLTATLASPSSSSAQKAAATKNLSELRDFSDRIHGSLSPRKC